MKQNIIIVAPSLNPNVTLGGVSSVAGFIANNNTANYTYSHFEQGRRDSDKSKLKRVFAIIANYRKWKRVLESNPNSIIHYNFPLSFDSTIRDYFFMRVAVRTKRKIVIHVHGGKYMNTESFPWLINKMLHVIFSWNVPFIVLSDKERQIIENRYKSTRVHVLQNSVVIDKAYKDGVFSTPPVIGYIGRIAQTKGMDELVEALKQLKEKGYHFKFHLAGNESEGTDYVAMFKEALEDKFYYAGIVSGNEKKEFLLKLDIFTLPSYFEGLPLSLLECMSYGIIPIVTSVGSITEVIDHNFNGLLIKDHDVDSLSEAIIELLNDKDKRIRLSKATRQTIIDKFSAAIYFKKLNDIYQSI